ncbi:MAG TPA: citramalate synthase [Nitrospinota bacterium]|nr:citramalate synthase [Nitrospinota bacterium]
MRKIKIYDTTLRDGTQAEDIYFSLEDKLRIAHKLDDLGIHYIEGGWPGSNPKDQAFFQKVRHEKFDNSRITSFGSTRKAGNKVEKDPNIKSLLESKTQVVTIFGKIWNLHVTDALKISLQENLDLIHDSVSFLKNNFEEVIFDAEHFFDGFKNNPDYALKAVLAAAEAKADWIVLCDTNGGTMPYELEPIMKKVSQKVQIPIGIHAHNDSETAVANSITAIKLGADQVHATINGYGERCGNANLCSIIPNIKLKLKMGCVSDEQMKKLWEVSRFINELANMKHWIHQPYVGKSAFAHKGGIHVDAVQKNRQAYEHIAPEMVGNHQRVLVSDLSGKSNILYKAEEYGIDLDSKDPIVQQILKELKELENNGFQFEGAEGSFELLMKNAKGNRKKFFDLKGFRVIIEKRREDEPTISEATIKIVVDGQMEIMAAEGNGPVNALDKALRKALIRFYPELKYLNLHDFKVRILDEKKGTEAFTRVLIESGDHDSKWGTVGVSSNIIEASWQALVDSVDYILHKTRNTK